MSTLSDRRRSARPKEAARDIFRCGDATFWRFAARPGFPRPRKLSARLTLYDVDELIAWRDAHLAGGSDAAE